VTNTRPRPSVPAARIRRAALAICAGPALAGAITLVAAPPQQQPSEVGVVIRGDGGRPPRYAVPDFTALTPGAADVGRLIGQVLWDDLAFEREFEMIPRDASATVRAASTAESVPFAAWRELGADAVVFGTVRRVGDTIIVQVRLLDVRTQRTGYSRQYEGASNPRTYAHTIADEIHMSQRGLRGVARTKLAFVSDRDGEQMVGTVETRTAKEIYLSDYDGAGQLRLTQARRLSGNPNWSPDGRTLAYTMWNPVPQIFLSRLYEGMIEPLTTQANTNYLPAFSPDGRRVAFMSGRDGNTEIYVQNVDGTGVRRMTNHPADDATPTWSPSGNEIAFTSTRAGRPQLYVMNATDGSNVRRLAIDEVEADRATWSPAPYNEIAYAGRSAPGRYDIKVLDVASGRVRQITTGEGSNESPVFSPTGRHLAFTSTRTGGSPQIFTIGRDGNGLRQITRQGRNTTPAWSN
jgi:TolB protein